MCFHCCSVQCVSSENLILQKEVGYLENLIAMQSKILLEVLSKVDKLQDAIEERSSVALGENLIKIKLDVSTASNQDVAEE